MRRHDDLKVFISHRKSKCDECDEQLGRGAWILLAGERSALCLSCADLDHLVFLPSGDTALTRRSRKHSSLSAVVLKWSRTRKRYERRGVLVEEPALVTAEEACLADEELRARQRLRAAERRTALDREYVASFAERLRELFPSCPDGREQAIAEHACQKYSGRVGRSAAARELDEQAIRLAVVAHVRHAETTYDALLMRGKERHSARAEVAGRVAEVLARWESS